MNPRPGAARTIGDEQVEQVLVTTLETTPTDATHWSTRSLARIDKAVPAGLDVHVICDNSSTHKTAIHRWLAYATPRDRTAAHPPRGRGTGVRAVDPHRRGRRPAPAAHAHQQAA
jgi:hypothetical protein